MDVLENLQHRYDHSPFNATLPLILKNNQPMFTSSLRAFRNTDCNRTTRIWVLYEDEVQEMEMDQTLIFDVGISDNHSDADSFHTPDEGSPPLIDPNPLPTNV